MARVRLLCVLSIIIKCVEGQVRIEDLQNIFNRALFLSFSKARLLFAFCVLALCGLLVIFFHGLATAAGAGKGLWVGMSLTFLPIFLCAGMLLAAGVVLIRAYHDEIKNRPTTLWMVIDKSWEVVMGATYFAIPFILAYLVLWIGLGFFILLSALPQIGPFFGVVLAFAPFLINVASLLLCLLNFAMLFFITPLIALKGLDRQRISQMAMQKLQIDLFPNLLLMGIAILPLFCVAALLMGGAFLTESVCATSPTCLYTVLQWFFIMIPFTALLAPAVVFFFHFAAESHILLQKK